jgi:hypothetical protein
MNKKIFVIKATVILLITMILAGANAQTVQNHDNIDNEEEMINEDIISQKSKNKLFGSISGITLFKVSEAIFDIGILICKIDVDSIDSNTARSRISFGVYRIGGLPVGHTYRVTASPGSSSSPAKIVTLTPEKPNARVNFLLT